MRTRPARVQSLAELIGARIGAGALRRARRGTRQGRPDDGAWSASFPNCRAPWAATTPRRRAKPPEVAAAIEEHYRPRFAGDALPATRDRTGARAGRQDRHAGRHLRDRAAADGRQGSFRLAPRGARRAAHPARRPAGSGSARADRTRSRGAAGAAGRHAAEEVYGVHRRAVARPAVWSAATAPPRRCSTRCSASRPRSPLDAAARLQALKEFLQLPDAAVLTAINKRIANILRKAPPEPPRRGGRRRASPRRRSGGCTQALAGAGAQLSARRSSGVDMPTALRCWRLRGGGGRFLRTRHGDGRGSGRAPQPPGAAARRAGAARRRRRPVAPAGLSARCSSCARCCSPPT